MLIRPRDKEKGLCKIMHPQDAVNEMTPPLKSFAFILSPSFKEAAQKGTISATLKGHFLYGIVRDEKVPASHSPRHFSSLQLVACVWKCICALKFIELVLRLAGSFLLLRAQIVFKSRRHHMQYIFKFPSHFFAWLVTVMMLPSCYVTLTVPVLSCVRKKKI